MPNETTLEERKASAPEKIDNASLPAGSPMTYYCKNCGHVTKVLPEDWWRDEDRPPEFCDWCVEHSYAIAIIHLRDGDHDKARELVGDEFVDGWMHAQEAS